VDQKPETIRHHIEEQRERLGENLGFLENRVRTATNWRTWIARNPVGVLAIAFGGGLLMGIRTK
jgi:hypothetical protein